MKLTVSDRQPFIGEKFAVEVHLQDAPDLAIVLHDHGYTELADAVMAVYEEEVWASDDNRLRERTGLTEELTRSIDFAINEPTHHREAV